MLSVYAAWFTWKALAGLFATHLDFVGIRKGRETNSILPARMQAETTMIGLISVLPASMFVDGAYIKISGSCKLLCHRDPSRFSGDKDRKNK